MRTSFFLPLRLSFSHSTHSSFFVAGNDEQPLHKKKEGISFSLFLSLFNPVPLGTSTFARGARLCDMQQPPPGSNGGAPLPVVAPLPLPMPAPPPPLPPPRAPSAHQLPPPPLPPPPPPRAGYRPGGGGQGFSPGQLHVLRHQIMAYRAIKVSLKGAVMLI